MRTSVLGLIAAVALLGLLFLVVPPLGRESMGRRCMDNMKSMGYAASVWSSAHGKITPTNWLSFSGELVSPRMLICPADKDRKAADAWTNFLPENTSYEIVGGGVPWGNINQVFFRCKIHGFSCFADGAVTRHHPAK